MTAAAQNQTGRHSTLFVVVVALFVTNLLISNVIANKAIELFGYPLQAADLIFPISYILGDVLTEVYGFRRARRVIWIGFGCSLFAMAAIQLGLYLPAHPEWTDQAAYAAILGNHPRILLASFAAYLVGEFVNSVVLAKMKVWMDGRYLWMRTIGSTVLGQGCDTVIFLTIAFYGIWPNELLFAVMFSQWIFKISYEALATPFTYLIVNRLKRAEGIDVYDRDTNFSPFAWEK
ncbi:MAG: queuosine precursor transporter [Rhodospirillaceae bacterium]|nr:queuosine precursor transporter [Rhodospirillaceae bacterium]